MSNYQSSINNYQLSIDNYRLPKGYKLTEVGVIPDDWEVKRLGELGKFKNGINKSKEDFGYGFPFVNLMDVFGIPKISNLAADFGLVNTTPDERDLYDLKSGDILFVRSSVKPEGVGLTTLIQHDFPNMVFSGFLIRFRDYGQLEIGFKEHCFFDSGFRARLISSSTVSANTNINQDALKSLHIAFPPCLSEQRSIASVLSDTDALLEALDCLIAKKRDLKQATMQQLLTGKTRLPGFGEGKGYKQTEVGVIPEDWDSCQVSKVTVTHKQGYYTKDKYVEDGIRLVRITDLYNPKIDYGAMPMLRISDRDFEQYRVSKGDFLIARSGAIGRYGIVEDDINAIFGSYIIRFIFDRGKLLNRFFGYLFETQMIWKQLLSITQGSSNININAGNIKELTIPLPSISEQTAIAQILSDMDTEIAALEQRRDKTRALKQGMMQELLTGRTRLIDN
jgi:type I restriction enzyme, S subunit